jgi:hypothetical protein
MELNLLSGRTFHDLCQYPVFPWVLSDYTSEILDLDDPGSFRDLTKPMGALDPKRLAELVRRFKDMDDPNVEKFLYGSLYSTAAGAVLHYLVRLETFRSLHVDLHGGRFDVADRLFNSVALAWEGSSSTSQDYLELTPEFYYLPAMFCNRVNTDLGVSQNGVRVHDVIVRFCCVFLSRS